MSSRIARLATCNLCQWSMDFDGNLKRIKASIEESRVLGARYRVGPELEVPGYGCEDHFNELDTETHSWECIGDLIVNGYSDGIVIDIGAPVSHKGVRYNCRIFILNSKVLLIRPKMDLANDGNYREPRYFSTWKARKTLDEFQLPHEIREATGQKSCPIGDGYLQFVDATLAAETCEELFTPAAPHIDLALAGVQIITNGSGSHHQLRKLNVRLDLMRSATSKAGGAYLYANQQGCDGGRLYYDGCACVIVNGDLVKQGSQFSVREVETVVADIDLDQIDTYRGALSSMRDQSSKAEAFPVVHVDFSLCIDGTCLPSQSISPRYLSPEEEIGRGPACWLWDYLRRSGASGFLLPLSGGADSASVAAIVGCMCQMIMENIPIDAGLKKDVERVCNIEDASLIQTHQDLARMILTTVYMGTANSSNETRMRASRLSTEIGAYHLDVKIDTVVSALTALFSAVTGKMPKFKVHGGTHSENAALQNIQARIRMVIAFLLAQLMPWATGKSGFLLVLGSGNVDEALRGYLTKYDCSSADLNPIGGVSKQDLRRFLRWAADALGYMTLAEIEAAPPTAELEPLDGSGKITQTDEADMGMTYEELSVFGRLRKINMCGPVSMYKALAGIWRNIHPPNVIADKVKHFFRQYSINRHKVTVLTPSYHAENYSPDDNRFDHRQFLYNMPTLCSSPRTGRGPARFVLPLNSNSRRRQVQSRIQGVKSKGEKSSSLDIDVFETIGTDKDTSKFEPFSNGLNLFRNLDTSEPVSFDGQEKVEFDPLRDGPLRYLGYSNELGEAFSAWLFPGGVSLSYAVAIAYVLFDTWDKYTKTLTEAEEVLGARRLPGVVDKDRLVSIIGLERGVDTLVWQLLASVILPGYTIHTVVEISSSICNRVLESSLGDDLFSRLGHAFMLEPESLQSLSEKSLPTFLGLLAIPFIVHPIDSAVHGVLNATLRKQLRKYICIQGKGAQAGLPICAECQK